MNVSRFFSSNFMTNGYVRTTDMMVEIVIQIVLKFWFTVPWQLGSTILGTLLWVSHSRKLRSRQSQVHLKCNAENVRTKPSELELGICPLFYYCTLGYTANILTVLGTAFGSVTCATVIWLCILQSKIAIDLILYSSMSVNVMCTVVVCDHHRQITVAHVTQPMTVNCLKIFAVHTMVIELFWTLNRKTSVFNEIDNLGTVPK